MRQINCQGLFVHTFIECCMSLVKKEGQMESIIKWLREVEHLAGEVYSMPALEFVDDKNLKKFLDRSAEDEAYHYHVMGSAAEFLTSHSSIPPAISVDEELRGRIIDYFHYLKDRIENHTLTRDELIEKLVEAEFSEWNDLFLYVVNTLNERTNEFKFPAAKMQAHIQSIAEYVEKVENKPGVIDKVRKLTPVWIEKILIVDDSPIVAKLVKNMLKRDGDIDIAENGKRALELITKKYYKLIISDVDMPEMDGLTLFDEATKRYPKLRNRFLFMTGDPSPIRNWFCDNNNVICLKKPISVKQLREEAKKSFFHSIV